MIRHGKGLVTVLVVGCMALGAASTAAAATETETFAYTGAAQTWTVPPGVTEATFDLYGAQGQGNVIGSPFLGGFGGQATATIAVTPGAAVAIYVGGSGVSGGFNGGGASPGRNGGGASDVRIGGDELANRVLVAGGGGAAGTVACAAVPTNGGLGGGETGGPGDISCPAQSAVGGGGGTQVAGGTASSPATAGGFGVGGSAGSAGGFGTGGGGGGGWFGGGGGLSGGGAGGGGSGHGPAGTDFQSGVREGNGLVTVSYDLDPPPLTTITSGPEGVTTNPSPSFSFESSQAGSTFQCSLDGAAFDPCTSPTTYSNLADGAHTFAVQATNAQLTTQTTPTSVAFAVDTTTAGSASAKPKQRQSKRKVVVKLEVAASDEPLTAKTKGKIKLGRKGFKLSPKTVDLAAGASQALKLKPKKDQDRILTGIAGGKTAKAKLQVKFTDASGNTAVEKLQVKLTG